MSHISGNGWFILANFAVRFSGDLTAICEKRMFFVNARDEFKMTSARTVMFLIFSCKIAAIISNMFEITAIIARQSP